MASQANAGRLPRLYASMVAVFALVLAHYGPGLEAKAADGPPFGGPWKSKHFQDHPLVGRVFDGSGAASDWSALADAVKRQDVVIVGETHTNLDHHAIQAGIALMLQGRLFATVFEMVPQRLQPVLDRANNGGLELDALGAALEWEKRGWGAFEAYAPIVEATLNGRARLIAGNPDEDMTRSLSRGGLKALSEDIVKETGLSLPLADPVQAGLIKEMATSHCNMLPETILPTMALVQRLRDGMMARATRDVLRGGTDSSAALIITGNGHARKDRGVPAVLAALKSGLFSLSIGLVDVSQGKDRFADYALTGDDGKPLYGFVVFTPRDNVDDPCELMRQQMKSRSTPKP